MKRNIAITVAALLGFVMLVLGIFTAQHWNGGKRVDESKFHGAYLKNPRAISEFALIDIDNQAYTNESLKGKWTMMFFGFTNCGYVCPTAMAELGKFYRLLEQQHVQQLPQVVMISIDPERDNLSKLKNYVKAFDKHFSGARGDMEKVKVLTKDLGIAHMKVNGKSGQENYDIQHSGAVMLINPQGQLNAFFTGPHDAKSLAEDYLQLVS